LLAHVQLAIANVLATNANDIAAPLPGMQAEGEREARLGADRMMRLKVAISLSVQQW
jgi:hypothetical protein